MRDTVTKLYYSVVHVKVSRTVRFVGQVNSSICILLQHLHGILCVYYSAFVYYCSMCMLFVYYCSICILLQHLYSIAAFDDWFGCLDRSSMHFSFPISCANCALTGPISDGLVQQAVMGWCNRRSCV